MDSLKIHFKDLAREAEVMARDIAVKFIDRLEGVILSAEEQEIVRYASRSVAECALFAIGASEQQKRMLAIKSGLAQAALMNIAAIEAMRADRAFRDTAMEVISSAISTLIRTVVAVPFML